MLTRRNTDPTYPGVLSPEQAITLQDALPIFTTNGARSLRMEADTGSLTAGKWADFVVLDEHLTSIRPEDIGAIAPKATIWKGQTVLER